MICFVTIAGICLAVLNITSKSHPRGTEPVIVHRVALDLLTPHLFGLVKTAGKTQKQNFVHKVVQRFLIKTERELEAEDTPAKP